MAIRDLSNILAIEAVPLSERALPANTYAALVESATRSPSAKALSFFRSADRLEETHVWTYAEFVGDITRAANAFTAWGVAPDRPVAFVLPNLPETHFVIWGGEAAGAALAINPMLGAQQIATPAGRRARLCPCHPGAGSATEGLVRFDRGAWLTFRLADDRVCRHGRLPRRTRRGRLRAPRSTRLSRPAASRSSTCVKPCADSLPIV